jgi:hypothetical protein
MATVESQRRSERRRRQRRWEQFNREPEVIALRREIARRQRYRLRHPYSGNTPSVRGLLLIRCISAGIQLGGRPPKLRRCRKRLGSRFCCGWRAPGTDRCSRHRREQGEP